MNNKFGTVLSTLLIIAGVTLWSVSILAAESVLADAPATITEDATVRLATNANEEAAKEAARSIQTLTKLDLDIRLVGPTSKILAAK